MSKLKGKVAVVTGASKGIGAGIAKALAADGASVVVNYASSKEGAEKVVKAITEKGGKAVAVGGDVSKAADAKAIIDAAIKNFGKLDILVNNSGVYEFQPIENVTEENFHKIFNVNVLGLLLTTKEAVKHLKEGGSIINIGSAVTEVTPPNSSVYTGTKGAVDAITGVLSRELGRAEDSRERAESGNGGDRRDAHGGIHRVGIREADCDAGAAGPDRAGERHRDDCDIFGVGRFGMAYGREVRGQRWDEVKTRSRKELSWPARRIENCGCAARAFLFVG